MFVFQKHAKVMTVILLVVTSVFLMLLSFTLIGVIHPGVIDALLMTVSAGWFGYLACRYVWGWIKSDPQDTALYEQIWDRLEVIRLLSPEGTNSVEQDVRVDDATVELQWWRVGGSYSYYVSVKVVDHEGELATRETYGFPAKDGYVLCCCDDAIGENLRYKLLNSIVWKVLLANIKRTSDWRAAHRNDLVVLDMMLAEF